MNCEKCNKQLEIGDYPFCPHGRGANTVIQDSIEGGMHMWAFRDPRTGEPQKVYSKTEIKKEAQRRGVESHVEHTPVEGSDKGPHTTRWVSVSPITEDERLKHWHESDPELSAIARQLR